MSETNDTTKEGAEALPEEATELKEQGTEEEVESKEVSEVAKEKNIDPEENPKHDVKQEAKEEETNPFAEKEPKVDPKPKENPVEEETNPFAKDTKEENKTDSPKVTAKSAIMESEASNEDTGHDVELGGTAQEADSDVEANWIKAENEAKRKKMLEVEALRQEEIAKKKLEDEEKARQDELMHPKREHFQRFVNTISFFAVLASFAMAVGQILGPALYEVSAIQWILRLYVVFLCFIMILVECSWSKHVRESSILRTWVPRGIFYIFIGVLGLEENEKSTFRDIDRSGLTIVQAYVTSIAYIVVAIGFGYILLGVTCMQKTYIKQCEEYQERRQLAWEARHPKKAGKKEEGSDHTGDEAV